MNFFLAVSRWEITRNFFFFFEINELLFALFPRHCSASALRCRVGRMCTTFTQIMQNIWQILHHFLFAENEMKKCHTENKAHKSIYFGCITELYLAGFLLAFKFGELVILAIFLDLFKMLFRIMLGWGYKSCWRKPTTVFVYAHDTLWNNKRTLLRLLFG